MKKSLFSTLVLALLVITGCSYNANVGTVKNVNVYSAYEQKIPGTFALIINADRSMLNPTIKASSYACSFHKYPMTFDDGFIASMKSANESIFGAIISRTNIPTVAEMQKDALAGYIVIQSKMFEPRIRFIEGFFSMSSTATVTIGIDYSVRDRQNNLILTGSLSAERSADGDAGAFCDKGIGTLTEATQKAMRELLERYNERLSNSEKLRQAFK